MSAQTRKASAAEACTCTLIGLFVAYVSGLIVYPLYGFDVTHAQNAGITAIFTIISVVRGYCVRRVFNWRAK